MATEIARHTRDTDRLFADLRNGIIDPLENEALNILEAYGLFPGAGLIKVQGNDFSSSPHLDDFHLDLIHQGHQTEAQQLAVHLLTKPAPMTLAKVLNVYFQNHPKGTDPDFQTECKQHCTKIIKEMGSYNIESLTRAKVKEFILKRVTEVKTLTVKREISVIKAAFNVVIREKELDIRNPFEGQTIPNLGKDKKSREPFTKDELKLIIKTCLSKSNDINSLLLLCVLMGTRLSELAGLRRSDVKLHEKIPYISLVEYGKRTLKTKNSVRDVPLLPLAVDVMKNILASHNEPMVFPRYNKDSEILGDNASATLNKVLIRIGIKGKTVHCARHTMRDLMRAADIPPYIIDATQGWGSNSVGESYGKGYSLNQKLDALKKALKPIL